MTTDQAATLDFTSALYLGLRHPSGALPPWSRFTTGVPAALRESGTAAGVARTLAALIGCERATLGPSTLHMFWDLFQALPDSDSAIYMDAGLYPIARWGIERAAARGVPVHAFPHHDADALRRLLARGLTRGRPRIVTDGFCPRCGAPAPLAAYVEAARRLGGCLIVDDTQALGVLGDDPGPRAPYGYGGGGSLRRSGVTGPDVIVVASMAKAFGVPLAVLAGSETIVTRFEATSDTRMHCSPPSIPALHAASHALGVNRAYGDALRRRLARLVLLFRRQLARAGLSVTGDIFPVQTLATVRGDAARGLHRALTSQRVLTVLRHDVEAADARLTLLLTARHTSRDIAGLAHALSWVGWSAAAAVAGAE